MSDFVVLLTLVSMSFAFGYIFGSNQQNLRRLRELTEIEKKRIEERKQYDERIDRFVATLGPTPRSPTTPSQRKVR